MNVCVIGLWHQGIVGAACLASLGYTVVAADSDRETVAKLNTGEAPIYEPGLDELLRAGIAQQRLSFTTDIVDAVSRVKDVFLMFDTAVNERDESDLSNIWDVCKAIAPKLQRRTLLVVTAQVPIGTCEKIVALIQEANPSVEITIAYIPENLRLGQAIDRFLKPPLPVIGADDEATLLRVRELLAPMNVRWETTDVRTAEMTKHALNGFLATSITFANELGNLCDEVGADGRRLAELLRMEPRVGSKAMLVPGMGFSGGTLARDVQTLRSFGRRFSVPTPFLDGLWTANQKQNATVVRRLSKALGGSLSGRVIAVLGLTYKPDTSTLRRSAALEVIDELVDSGASVRASDPKASSDSDFKRYSSKWTYFSPNVVEAVDGAEALLLMTPWSDYKSVDFNSIKHRMRSPHIVFDTAGLWNSNMVTEVGLRYMDIGRGRIRQRLN